MEYKDRFEKEILTRTLNIWDNYSGPFEETLFLNLCVGLLIIPKESLYNQLPTEEVSISNWDIDPSWITLEKNNDKTVKTTIRHIRNAIAHNGIAFVGQNAVIACVEIEDKDISRQTSFTMRLDISNFKDFVLKVARLALSFL
jgi:hypothetical protein